MQHESAGCHCQASRCKNQGIGEPDSLDRETLTGCWANSTLEECQHTDTRISLPDGEISMAKVLTVVVIHANPGYPVCAHFRVFT